MHYTPHLLRHARWVIGQNLQRLRMQQKMPLHKLSRLSGLSTQKIDYYELGKDEIPLDAILKIVCALKAKIEDVIKTDCLYG